ncbi:hypothetical protein [Fodinibius salsisoli]|uniref:Uncharacterized protein n=1 Tax=Fodinibius salsisoli TaxID=2820877 RepID=A0ABT3PSL4_9BACT|nr:hypothetical protein [Fodinibius salsisoli]MCW9708827.1 hypothetical protein [Fodinibius salsisoli]
MAVDKKFCGVRVTAHLNGTQVFSGLVEELSVYLAQGHPVDKILVHEQEHIPSIQMNYEEFVLLVGDPPFPDNVLSGF